MNSASISSRTMAFRFRAKRGTRSATLVIVLAILVLVLVLIVGFFAAAVKMASSSSHYASGSSALALSESAVGIVTSQIRLATANEPTVTWTSQPGLLRTFDNTGSAQQIYKLYSAPYLTAPATATAAAANGSTAPVYNESDDTPSSTWNTMAFGSALYVDINRPSLDSSGNLVYPVVDPNATVPNTTTGRLPVVGFTTNTPPGGYNPNLAASATNNPLPMPVLWYYVLANGGIAVPTSVSASGDVTFATTSPVPSATNPIVGRVGFWTDDDTCKVNINTAGYGANILTNSTPTANYMTYWGTPNRMSNEEELFLSRNQPWTGEFQRYPGHPATTGLNFVFPELSQQQIFSMTPRYVMGGSLGGTTTNTTAGSTIPVRQDRLYASVDELFYNTNAATNPTGRSTNNIGTLSYRDLDTKRFFLTAQSRAPEVNLFGQPRVTIWPIWDITNTPSYRSVLDSTIAFDSTIGGARYYFTRHDPTSPTTDINLSDSLGSNLGLYAYLQRNTGRAIPGFGGNFLTKYPVGSGGVSDRDEILTDIFDTIRISNLAQVGGSTPYTSNTNSAQIMGQVVPTIHPNGTRGAGRMFCITEASLVFLTSESSTNGPPQPAVGAIPASKSNVQMGLLYKFYLPESGAVASGADFYYTTSGLTNFTVNADAGTAVQIFPTNTYTHTDNEYNFTATYGGATLLPTCASDNYRSAPGTAAVSGSLATYTTPPISSAFQVTGTNFYFNGGTNTVTIYTPGNSTPVQQYTFGFPAISTPLPVPYYYPTSSSAQIVGPWTTNYWTSAFTNSLGGTGNTNAGRFSTNAAGLYGSQWVGSGSHEIVRSLQLANGDVRSVANMQTVPASMFQPTPNYFNSSPVEEHGLETMGNIQNNATFGTMINGMVYGSGSTWFNAQSPSTASGEFQEVPVGMNGVTNSLGQEGDWDNGFGAFPDGAYLPKADEGVSYSVGSTGDPELWGYFVKNNGVSKLMYTGLSPTLYSANRQVASAVEFGDIPTGVQRGLPWQTLLFRPARSYHMGGTSHPGAASPPDYLLLDLFQMPVVEPYAISEPFSTAGKANMNYRIKPFSSYITRDTAVRSVLESTLIDGISEAAAYGWRPDRTSTWAQPMYASGNGNVDTRFPIDASQTLSYFETRFNGSSSSGPPPVFVSESEICGIDLIPQGWTTNNIGTFWNPGALTTSTSMRYTGDNSLEKPYATLYPRLTTRSNTYTVHVFSEALTPAPASAGGWNEGSGRVTGQWRGEYCLERYVDPNDSTIPNFQQQDANLNTNYIFHTIYSKRFAP